MATIFERFLATSLAAVTAAGLMIGAAAPVSAAVVYVDSPSQLSGLGAISLDLNLDAVFDITLTQTKTSAKIGSGPATQTTTYAMLGTAGTQLTGGGPLIADTLIGNTLSWSSSVAMGAEAKTGSTRVYSGDWLSGSSSGSGYLGFALSLADGIHYGWIEMMIDAAAGTTYILGYAFETVAGTPIPAGATTGDSAPEIIASVPTPAAGLLLLGAIAVPLTLRRRKPRA